MAVQISNQTAIAALRVKLRQKAAEERRIKYQFDPSLWIEERAGGFMWSIPRKIAQSIVEHRRTAVPACHGLGKSWLFGRIAAWWIDSHPPGSAFVVTTAPTSKQVKVVLWKEIRRAFVAANLDGRLNQTEWWLNGEMVAMGRKPSDYDPTAFQGIHAKYCLVLLDEGCGIPENIYIAANSLASNEFSRIAVIGNPDDPDSHFEKICRPGSGWNVIPISAYDTPNFTGEECPQDVKDVLTSPIYVQEMKHDVGEDSAVFTSKVLGRFPENKKDGVIPMSFIKRCQDEEALQTLLDSFGEDGLRAFKPVEIGVDVGAGGDETSLRVRYGKIAGEFFEKKTPEPEEAFYIVAEWVMKTGATRCKIDTNGIGWGLRGMLLQAAARGLYEDEQTGQMIDVSHCEFVGVNVGRGATDPARFVRLRSQMWWEVGRGLSQDKAWDLTLLDDVTIDQLTRPTYSVDISNRIFVEPKTKMMERTKRPSPNRADALLMAFIEPPLEEDEEYLTTYYDPVQISARL